MLGLLLSAGGAAAMPATALAAHAPAKVYVAFFLGQGGYLFSWGVPHLESEARRLGFATDVYAYTEVREAFANIVRHRKQGYKIALVGYSLGNTTATYLQSRMPVDLLLAIAESSLGANHPIRKQNTRRSVLWYGPDMLSNAGVRDGFDKTTYVDRLHLVIDTDPQVVTGVLEELRALQVRAVRPVITARKPQTAPADGKPADAKPADTGPADGAPVAGNGEQKTVMPVAAPDPQPGAAKP